MHLDRGRKLTRTHKTTAPRGWHSLRQINQTSWNAIVYFQRDLKRTSCHYDLNDLWENEPKPWCDWNAKEPIGCWCTDQHNFDRDTPTSIWDKVSLPLDKALSSRLPPLRPFPRLQRAVKSHFRGRGSQPIICSSLRCLSDREPQSLASLIKVNKLLMIVYCLRKKAHDVRKQQGNCDIRFQNWSFHYSQWTHTGFTFDSLRSGSPRAQHLTSCILRRCEPKHTRPCLTTQLNSKENRLLHTVVSDGCKHRAKPAVFGDN